MSLAISGTAITFPDASVQSSAASGFKNRIINGNMVIAQRATSATVTAGTAVPTASTGYPCVDRFFVYSTGANVTAAQVAGSGATQYRLQITGAASVTAVGVGQRIEQMNSYDMAGSTATLSVDLANSLLTTVTWTASYATTADTFGTIGTPTKTQIATGTFTVSSTVTNYSAQISIPSAATTGIEILFTVGAQTSGTLTVGKVQLAKSATVEAFDVRPIGAELALCQRYVHVVGGNSSFQRFGSGLNYATTNTVAIIPFPVTMRSTPSLSYSSISHFSIWNGAGATTAATNVSLDALAVDSCGVNIAVASGLTAGSYGQVMANNTTSARLTFSAEL